MLILFFKVFINLIENKNKLILLRQLVFDLSNKRKNKR